MLGQVCRPKLCETLDNKYQEVTPPFRPSPPIYLALVGKYCLQIRHLWSILDTRESISSIQNSPIHITHVSPLTVAETLRDALRGGDQDDVQP